MIEIDKNMYNLQYVYQHELGDALIYDEVVDITIKKWTMIEEKQLIKLHLGILKDPKMVLINVALPLHFIKRVEAFLNSYKDGFTYSYK
jgi:hypothetical protein